MNFEQHEHQFAWEHEHQFAWDDRPISSWDKPPLGLMPRKQWQEACRCNRVGAILDAMKRYNESAKAIPTEWFDELRELTDHDRKFGGE